MKIRGANVRIFSTTLLQDVEAVLKDIQRHGGNAVAFTFSYYVSMGRGTPVAAWPPVDWRPDTFITFIYPDVGQDPAHPFCNTPTLNDVYTCCNMAKNMGFQHILLKPHIDSYDAYWRGAISVQGVERAFSVSYRRDFLEPLLPIVRELDIDLCIGTELVQITRELGARFWVNLARWLRDPARGVTQPLTYAANWGWELSAEYNLLTPLWDRMEYIGIDAYWPMADPWYDGPVNTAALLSGHDNIGWHRALADPVTREPQPWCPPIYEDVARLAAQVARRVVLTEFGYPNNMAATVDPAGDIKGYGYTLAQSLPLWEAARAEWDREGSPCDGWYAWEAGPPGVEERTSHDILGTPIADIAWGE